MRLHNYFNIVQELTDRYHSKNLIHGNINPDTLIQCTTEEKEQQYRYCHPQILTTRKATTVYHDYYALFATALFIEQGHILNSDEHPILEQIELEEKIDIFMRTDFLSYSETVKNILHYLYKLSTGEVYVS